MSGGGKGGDKKGGGVPVTDYFMSIQIGLCHGPIDHIFRIKVKEKEAWVGDQAGEGGIFVDKPDLFGGNKKEGGVRGCAYVMPGNGVQVLPEGLAQRIGLTSLDAPAGRGRASIWFVGGTANTTSALGRYQGYSSINLLTGFGGSGGSAGAPGSGGIGMPDGGMSAGAGATIGGGGFMWGSNNPYMPNWEVTVSRRPVGLPLSTASIPNSVTFPEIPASGDDPEAEDYVPAVPPQTYQWPDANAVHVAFECMTNPDWGMGAVNTQFNMPMWEAAAQTVFDEKFGISLQWTQQARIEDFVKEALDHVQAVLYVNPRNGLWEIRLIRNDYDVDTLRRFGPDDCVANDIQRKAYEETINEIVVSWTNPISEETETVTQQDIANIAIQGTIVSDARNYYGIRRGDLAMEVAVRDLRSASTPLVSANVEMNRRGWNLSPGECLIFDWPEDGIEGMIMRIGEVDYGKPGDARVKVSLVEDIFSLDLASYYSPPATQWVDDDRPALPMTFVEIMTAPYALMRQAGYAVTDDDYPAIGTIIMGASAQPGVNEFELSTPRARANGDDAWTSIGSMMTVAHGYSVDVLPAEAITEAVTFRGIVGAGEGPVVNGMAVIGKGEDKDIEIALVKAYTVDGFTLTRGLLDTVPRAWPAGTTVWFLNENTQATDRTSQVPGPVQYRLQTRTRDGLLPFSLTPISQQVVTDRPYLPQRPANVKVGGVGFGEKSYDGAIPVTVPVTWATRNRLLEDTVFPSWASASNAPEDGQRTRIEIIDRDTLAVIETHEDLEGTSFDIPIASFHSVGGTTIRVSATREDMVSLQAHSVDVDIAGFGGYGNAYGLYYGE